MITRLRRRRRGVVHALVAALLLPLLLALLPAPALSAAAALDRDIAQSACAPGGAPGGAQDHAPVPHAAGHEHCILCMVRTACAMPHPGAVAAAFAQAPEATALPAPARRQELPPPLAALIEARPPRGPPIVS